MISDPWGVVNRWQAAWKQHGGSASEELRLLRNHKSYVLVDTRRLWRKKKLYRLGEAAAAALLTPRPFTGKEIETWAVHKSWP